MACRRPQHLRCGERPQDKLWTLFTLGQRQEISSASLSMCLKLRAFQGAHVKDSSLPDHVVQRMIGPNCQHFSSSCSFLQYGYLPLQSLPYFRTLYLLRQVSEMVGPLVGTRMWSSFPCMLLIRNHSLPSTPLSGSCSVSVCVCARVRAHACVCMLNYMRSMCMCSLITCYNLGLNTSLWRNSRDTDQFTQYEYVMKKSREKRG